MRKDLVRPLYRRRTSALRSLGHPHPNREPWIGMGLLPRFRLVRLFLAVLLALQVACFLWLPVEHSEWRRAITWRTLLGMQRICCAPGKCRNGTLLKKCSRECK